MTSRAAFEWLFRLQLFGVKLGLENIRVLLAALGNPERNYPAILITGTNGKGSVAAMTTAVLREQGHRVGTYTSPHLVRFGERIAIDGVALSSRRIAAHAALLKATIARLRKGGRLRSHPTFFEVTTAMAMIAFARARIDVAVVEVGLGGRFDATNALDPVVSVLTCVALEHTRWLGSTVAAIASEKCGIARPGRPFICGVSGGPALAMVRARTAEIGARLVLARRRIHTRLVAARSDGLRVDAETPIGALRAIDVELAGRHQEHNLGVTLATLLALPPELRPDARSIRRGLGKARWPGRLERRRGAPELLLDGAHNPHAATALAAYLREFERARRIVLLFACLQDKDLPGITRKLFPLASAIVLTRLRSPRAVDPELIRSAAPGSTAIAIVPDLERALDQARATAGRGGLVVATGSLYLVGELRALLDGEAAPDQG